MEYKENTVRLKWKCLNCKSENVSFSIPSHSMDYCQCGHTAVDLEEHYDRIAGDVVVLSKEKFLNNSWSVYKD